MISKGTKLYSILTGACPKCHQENMFKDTNPYHITQLFNMYERCNHCNTKYKMEPSFFYGAMYVSYGVGIAFAVPAFIISFVFCNSSLKTAFAAIVITLLACLPIIIRVSRNIWINIFMHYDATLAKPKTK